MLKNKVRTIVMGGKGAVGGAIFRVLRDHRLRPEILDLDVKPKPGICSVLHVCIPWHVDFVKIVKGAIKRYSPKLVIVHSSVQVGTTRQLGSNAAHSPVRGQHDKLEHGIMRFIKFVGGVTPKTTKAALEHLQSAGMPVVAWGKPEDTELMKLLCLSRYLNDLAYYEKSMALCKRFKVSPGLLYAWTDSYNDGYAGTKYVRPALSFPNGKAGGHCVMPVSKILQSQVKDGWLGKNIRVFEPSGH